MNITQKRTIRSLLKKMTPQEAVKFTRFTLGQVLSAQFAWFTYFAGEISLYKTREEFKSIQKQTIHALRDLRPIEELTDIPQLEINKYWYMSQAFRLGDYLHDIYHDLTSNETV